MLILKTGDALGGFPWLIETTIGTIGTLARTRDRNLTTTKETQRQTKEEEESSRGVPSMRRWYFIIMSVRFYC